jgi:hypothetical protein
LYSPVQDIGKNSVFRLEGPHDPSAGFFLPIRRMPDQTAHSALQPVIIRINDVEAASFIGNSARALTRRGLFSFTAPPTRHKPTRPYDIATYGCCKTCRGQHPLPHRNIRTDVSLPPSPRCTLARAFRVRAMYAGSDHAAVCSRCYSSNCSLSSKNSYSN